jgi:hypothetical protein
MPVPGRRAAAAGAGVVLRSVLLSWGGALLFEAVV